MCEKRFILAWLKIQKAPLMKAPGDRRDTPDGLWHKCTACLEIIYRKDFEQNLNVCIKCHHHFPLSAEKRIDFFLDHGSFKEHDQDLISIDPLHFKDTKSYRDRLDAIEKMTSRTSAVIAGEGLLLGMSIQIAVFDFSYLGGSMGAVEGEKIVQTFLRAIEQKTPAIVFSASGGARMQEGIISLMQMAKTCAALAKLREAKLPLISILTNPTTGGVAASYALLGDVNVGEPGALIGFAGPRVIQQTIGQSLPEGFQTSEYLLEHGMLDMICHRDTLRDQVAKILNLLCSQKGI